ncbi:hypothetical protein D3C75_1245790 [compost metagenome]
MFGFLAGDAWELIRIEDRVLAQIRYSIDTRVIPPPLIVRLHTYFSGYNIGVHCVEVLDRKFRVNDS